MSISSKTFELHQRASFEFSPLTLSRYITFDENVPVFDRKSLPMTNEILKLFYVALCDIYKGDHTMTSDDTTIYFEPRDVLYAGAYSISEHRPLTRVPVARARSQEYPTAYTYTDETFCEICKKMINTP